MDRQLAAAILDECGTLLELKGESSFRCNAYHNAARAVLQLEGDLAAMIADKSLAKIKGIGATMLEKLSELAQTGKIQFHQDLRAEIPAGLVEMLNIQGLGPKKVAAIYKELGIGSIPGLKAACLDGRLANLKGMGPKTAQKILAGIEFLGKTSKRVLAPVAQRIADRLRDDLAKLPQVQRIELAGSLRRRQETIKDIDLLVASDDPAPIMKRFVEHNDVERVTNHGATKSSVVLRNGMPADLRVVSREQFPFALHYFTGSKAHNVAMRQRAQERGLKLNEYELAGADRAIACAEEADIFAALDLDYIPPELREDTGEILAAENHSLPKLLERSDLTGCFHCHTTESDGQSSLEEMAAAAQQAGLTYLGIADHSQTAAYAGGLKPDRVRAQHRRIDQLNEKLDGLHLFKGIESDILADGSLDYDDDTLASFDYIVASVHMPMNMDEATMTARVIKAISHPRCTMLGHSTGRLLLRRDAYPIDLEAVLRAAAKHDTLIEINANPMRRDLDWVFCKRAKALGVTLVINPDAHAAEGIDDLKWGVDTARRGWLEKSDVFNTGPLDKIQAELKRRRQRG